MPINASTTATVTKSSVPSSRVDNNNNDSRESVSASSSSPTATTAASAVPLFDCRPLCTALRVRWRHLSYKKKVGSVLSLLENHRLEVSSSWRRKFPRPPNDDDLDGLLGSNSEDEEDEEEDDNEGTPLSKGGKQHNSSSTSAAGKRDDIGESSFRSDMSTSSRSSSSRRPMTISSLQRFIFQAVDDVKGNLPEHPWHKALQFVSFDLPLQHMHVVEWIDMLVKRAELYELEDELKAAIRRQNGDAEEEEKGGTLSPAEMKRLQLLRAQINEEDAAVRSRILASLPPSAQGNSQTVAFLDTMLMPLREFFVASVICSLLSQVSTTSLPTGGSVGTAASSRRASLASAHSAVSGSGSASQNMVDAMAGSLRDNEMVASSAGVGGDAFDGTVEGSSPAFPSCSSPHASTSTSSHPKKQEPEQQPEKRAAVTFTCHHHAALHAKDLDAVHYIHTLTPNNPVGLYQFVHAAAGGNADNIIIGDGLGTSGTVQRIKPGTTSMADIAGITTPGRLIGMLKRATEASSKSKGTTSEKGASSSAGIPFQSRYAQYHLIYLDDSVDWDDTTFVAAMMPLAESGLAHAQYDVGMCFLSLRETDEACSWLERATKYGHSKAALTLARLHLSMAFEADTIVDKNPTDKSQEILDAVKVPPPSSSPTTKPTTKKKQLTFNSGGAINGFATMDRDTKIRQLTHYHVTKALSWLDRLSRSNWDAETVLKDIPDGEALKATIQRDAAALLDSRAKKEETRSRRWAISLRVGTLCMFAIALASIIAYLVGWLDGSYWDEYGGGGGSGERGWFGSFFPRHVYRTLLDGIHGGQYTMDPTTGKPILLYSSGAASDIERPDDRYKADKGPTHVKAKEPTHANRRRHR